MAKKINVKGQGALSDVNLGDVVDVIKKLGKIIGDLKK